MSAVEDLEAIATDALAAHRIAGWRRGRGHSVVVARHHDCTVPQWKGMRTHLDAAGLSSYERDDLRKALRLLQAAWEADEPAPPYWKWPRPDGFALSATTVEAGGRGWVHTSVRRLERLAQIDTLHAGGLRHATLLQSG